MSGFYPKKTALGYYYIQIENPPRNSQGNIRVNVQVTSELRPISSFVGFWKEASRDKMRNQSRMKSEVEV